MLTTQKRAGCGVTNARSPGSKGDKEIAGRLRRRRPLAQHKITKTVCMRAPICPLCMASVAGLCGKASMNLEETKAR